ncbi:MAG: hypothetical protein JWP81_1999 [Ferruginibacter sp.]|nr:hypothetical protein [Ferruginibacter sp.]
MADNKNIRDDRDNNKIDIHDPSEVEYVHQQFPNLQHAEIVEAIRLKGPSRAAVMTYLKSRQ